jgi:hypothetical protein
MDGIKRVGPIDNPLNGLFEISEFATYQSFAIDVASGNEAPVAVLAPNPANGCDGCMIWFDASGSYDNDGTIDLYEFDFDYDGVNFVADVSGIEVHVQSPSYATGSYTAALQVFDNLGASDIDTVPVNITPIDGLDVDPYAKTYVTDTSFSNIIFTPNGFTPNDTQNRQRGLEAMATNSQYIFAVFYASGNDGDGVYIARSGDNGATWGDYNLVHETTPGATFAGVAIDVVDSEVFIAVGEINTYGTFLLYNNSNGEGLFDEYQLSDLYGYSSISVAADPVDTNNIYVGVAKPHYTFVSYTQEVHIYTSNTGPAGTFTEEMYNTWYRPPPYGYFTQGYELELKVAADQDVYLVETANATLAVKKSEDFGATFTEIYGSWDPQGSWGRDSDYCFDPSDPETIHWVTTYRVPSTYRHSYRRSTNGGVSWSTMQYNLGSNTQAYTNAAICTDSAGNIYIVYTDKSSGNGEVYGRFSNDGGSSFGPVIQISEDDPGNDGHVEITPTTHGCDVVIGWLEDRDGERRVVSRRG